MSYEAFVLTQQGREKLAKLFPPKNPMFVGHHITHRFGVPRTENVPYGQHSHGWFEVVGYAEADGLEVLVVKVAGKQTRPDGKAYHITWSLDPAKGVKPKHSNDLIAARGWAPLNLGYAVEFEATFDYVD
jgi:hypothetical protein